MYIFDPAQHHLLCLWHILNLAITAVVFAKGANLNGTGVLGMARREDVTVGTHILSCM